MSEAFWDIQLHFIISTSLLVKSWQMFSWTNMVLFIWISTLSCYYQQLIPHRFLSDVLLHYKLSPVWLKCSSYVKLLVLWICLWFYIFFLSGLLLPLEAIQAYWSFGITEPSQSFYCQPCKTCLTIAFFHFFFIT